MYRPLSPVNKGISCSRFRAANMTLLLNYLPWLVLFAGAFAAGWWWNKKWYILTVTVLAFVALIALTPSYLPKGAPTVVGVPEFEQKELEVKDELLKPTPEAEQDKRMEEKFDWKRKTQENAEQEN